MNNSEIEKIVREVLQKLSEHQSNANGGLIQTSMSLALALKLIERIEAKAAEWNMRVVTKLSFLTEERLATTLSSLEKST